MPSTEAERRQWLSAMNDLDNCLTSAPTHETPVRFHKARQESKPNQLRCGSRAYSQHVHILTQSPPPVARPLLGVQRPDRPPHKATKPPVSPPSHCKAACAASMAHFLLVATLLGGSDQPGARCMWP